MLPFRSCARGQDRVTALTQAIEKKRADFGRVYTGKRRSLRLLSAWEAYDSLGNLVAEEGVELPTRKLRADGIGSDFVGDWLHRIATNHCFGWIPALSCA